jgi:thiamine-monophosphate kinase
MAHDELELVAWLREKQRFHPEVALGIGDDMAALALRADFTLIASDMLLDGVHFDSGNHGPPQIGRKALACALSDCAAMAVRPVAAIVSLAIPSSMSLAEVKSLYEGMFALAEECDTAIVGGDTTRWGHPLAIDVGVVAAAFEGIDPVTRCRARPGDRLYVTGKLGGSLLGAHLSFVPRLREAEGLARELDHCLHAMIDISDGLALDLWRLCGASGVGAVLEERHLAEVINDDAERAAAADGRPALEHALSDGEDFELLFAAAPEAEISACPSLPIGVVTDSGLQIRGVDGTMRDLEVRGWVH